MWLVKCLSLSPSCYIIVEKKQVECAYSVTVGKIDEYLIPSQLVATIYSPILFLTALFEKSNTLSFD